MEDAQVRIEVERIVNLVAGFGWAKIEEKVVEEGIILTIKKIIPFAPPE